MHKIKFLIITSLFLIGLNSNAQTDGGKSEFQQITETLMDYIEGTGNGELDRLNRAFHPDFNLYSVTQENTLRTWKGSDYVGGIKEGKKSNRIGRIIAIDFEKDAATAKVEIVIPNWKIFIDYFLLLKYEGSWKIVHKSYTSRPFPKADKK